MHITNTKEKKIEHSSDGFTQGVDEDVHLASEVVQALVQLGRILVQRRERKPKKKKKKKENVMIKYKIQNTCTFL
jgi:hypothetical protein